MSAMQNSNSGRSPATAIPNSLPYTELAAALIAEHRADLCVGGIVDKNVGIVCLIRGNLEYLVVPLSSFGVTPEGEKPDFSRFVVKDGGQTPAFGDYEAGFDAVLYEQDQEYRRRKNGTNN